MKIKGGFILPSNLNVDSKYTSIKFKNDSEPKIFSVTAVIMGEVQYSEYSGATLIDEEGIFEKADVGTHFQISEAIFEDGVEKRHILGVENSHTVMINFELLKMG